MRFNLVQISSILAMLAFPGTIGACAGDVRVADVAENDPVEMKTVGAQLVAQTMATALSSEDARMKLLDALRTSPHPEGKVHLRTFLVGDGAFLLKAMAEQPGASRDMLRQALDNMGSMELYMPVKEHRESWSGGDDLIIVFQLEEEDDPTGFNLDGSVADLTLDAPPSTPVLSFVPAESFEDDGTLIRRTATETLTATVSSPALTSYTGLWVTYSHLGDLHEPWIKGDPEIEFHLQNASTRADIRCVEQDNTVEPYRFDQNDNNYTKDFLLAQSWEIPQGVPLLIVVYEDDDKRCVIKDNKDYVKLTADALKNAFGSYNSFVKNPWNGTWVFNAIDAATALISIITGNDDYVGSAVAESVGWTETEVTLSNPQLTPTGFVRLQLKTDVAH